MNRFSDHSKNNTASTGPQRRQLLLVGGAALLAGCAAKTALKVPPDQWPVVQIDDASVMPDKAALSTDRLGRRTKVVVMQPEEPASAPKIGLADVAAGALQALLGAGGVEVVDRKLAGKLDQELRLIETRGGAGSYSGAEVADFAVTVVMGLASWGSRYTEATSYVDKKTNKTVTNPGYHTHTGGSKMTLRIYELPSLRLVASIPTEGSVSVNDPRFAAQLLQAPNLMRSATEEGVSNKKAAVLNELSPKGYISEKRARDKLTIFRALISKQTGAKSGDAVEIYSLKRSTDSLTGRTSTDQSLVASGRVSDVVGEESSWVIVDDEKAAARVRRGDIIKVRHSTSWFDNIKVPSILKFN